MAYSTVAVANAFIQRALDGKISELTPMKLQKLMFYAQSWMLKIYNEELIDEHFCKWQYGPVIPSLYHEIKNYGSEVIKDLIPIGLPSFNGTDITFSAVTPKIPEIDNKSWALIDKIISVYGEYSGTDLSYLTHQEGTAWYKTKRLGDVMPSQLLKDSIGN